MINKCQNEGLCLYKETKFQKNYKVGGLVKVFIKDNVG